MVDRIDALGGEPPERFAALRGAALSDTKDPALEAIVREAAAVLGTPIAAVSLVLARTQLFRAHIGMPADLAAVGATDRDVSFCQFVVKGRDMFEVNDAANDARVPKDLVERYGIRAYLGAPVRSGDTVLGSLCGIDVVPRAFEPEQREQLSALAARASMRLAELARDDAGAPRLAARAAQPALAELRNRLTPVRLSLDAARVSVVELGALRRLAALAVENDVAAAGALESASAAIDDVAHLVHDLDRAIGDIADGIDALGRLLLPSRDCTLQEVVEAGARLAHHHTKLVGGAVVLPLPRAVRLRVPRPVAVAVVGAVLSACARDAAHALSVRTTYEHGWARIAVDAGLAAAECVDRAEALCAALGDEARVAIEPTEGGLVVTLAAAEGNGRAQQ